MVELVPGQNSRVCIRRGNGPRATVVQVIQTSLQERNSHRRRDGLRGRYPLPETEKSFCLHKNLVRFFFLLFSDANDDRKEAADPNEAHEGDVGNDSFLAYRVRQSSANVGRSIRVMRDLVPGFCGSKKSRMISRERSDF